MVDVPLSVEIIHRDDELLVLHKPSGLETTSPSGGDCLVTRAKALDPRAPRLHPSSRLDREVSGLVVFARTAAATRLLLEARAKGAYHRFYVGLAAAAPHPSTGRWSTLLGIDPGDPRRRVVVAEGHKRARSARRAMTAYETVTVTEGVALVHLRPHTGRTHQLRVHCQWANAPLLGDVHYGGSRRLVRPDGRVVTLPRVMLHCAAVEIRGPSGSQRFEAPIPNDLRTVWIVLGGDPGALPR